MPSLTRFLKPRNYLNKFIDYRHNVNHYFGRESIVTTNYKGIDIKFSTSNYVEYIMRAKNSYTAEKSTMYWIDNYIKKDDVVYDIGANVGAYSLLIGKKMKMLNGTGQVYAIEPESLNFAKLNINTHINDLCSFVKPLCMSIGDNISILDLNITDFMPGASRSFQDSSGVHTQLSYSTTIDNLSFMEGMKFPNHIKIDVDGLEWLIVQHMEKTMEKTMEDQRLKTIVVEVNEGRDLTLHLIDAYGFEYVTHDKWVNGGKEVHNILFARD